MEESVGEDQPSTEFLEGVGNEVFCSILSLIVIFIPVIYLLWTHRHRAFEAIPPAQRALVEEAFRRFRVAQNNENDDPASGDSSTSSRHRPPPSAPPPPSGGFNRDDCAICMNLLRYAVQTNCGHVFCTRCIITYWEYGASFMRPVACPVCRCQVTLLLQQFHEADPDDPDRLEAVNKINQYNRRFSGQPRPMMDYIRDVPVLLPHMISQFFSVNGLMYMFRIRVTMCVLFAVAYILSPLDIIPEAVFGIFGLLDDIFILLVFILYLTVAYRHFVAGTD